jgi:hypothetical protein
MALFCNLFFQGNYGIRVRLSLVISEMAITQLNAFSIDYVK